MKKLICALLATVLVLSCLTACGKKETVAAPTEAVPATTLDPASPEAMYGHIDQTTLIDGVYKLWNAEGVKFMTQHPEGSFEILCHIDMQGAELAPIGTVSNPFAGTLNGANCTISNFTVKGSKDGCLGFVGASKGTIRNLYLDKMTLVSDDSAKHIGALAGINNGSIQHCTVTGTMTVEKAVGDALCGSLVGASTGTIKNSVANVDLTYTAPGKATVAGIAGSAQNNTFEYVETNGKLTVVGADKKTALFIGDAKGMTLNTLVFAGADNSQDGKLFTNYFVTEKEVTYEQLLTRDNGYEREPAHVEAKRQQVVDYMYAMATFPWKVREDMVHSCVCSLGVCHGSFLSDYQQYGPPYNHKASSLLRMQYCVDEEGYLREFVQYAGAMDAYDAYIGSDCSSAVQQALLTVGAEVHFTQTQSEIPSFHRGTYPVGNYEIELGLDLEGAGQITKNYIEHNGEEVMMECYAQVRKGDAVVRWFEGYGHTRLCATDAVVVRDENGKISPNYSYIIMHEQGLANFDEINKTNSTWTINRKYSFGNLYGEYYLPVTIKEFITGEFEEIDTKLEGGVSDSRLGLTTGTITSNYAIDNVRMQITDGNGKVVYDHRLFTTVTTVGLDGSVHNYARMPCKAYNLANFAAPLQQQMSFKQGMAYHAVITAQHTSGEEVIVHDFTFTNG